METIPVLFFLLLTCACFDYANADGDKTEILQLIRGLKAGISKLESAIYSPTPKVEPEEKMDSAPPPKGNPATRTKGGGGAHPPHLDQLIEAGLKWFTETGNRKKEEQLTQFAAQQIISWWESEKPMALMNRLVEEVSRTELVVRLKHLGRHFVPSVKKSEL